MADLDAIAYGLQTRLATIPGIRAHDVWPDQVSPPAILVDGPVDVQDLAIGCNSAIFTYEIVLVVAMNAGLAEGQRRLRPYLGRTGESSIFATLEADKRLGGTAQTLIVRGGVQLLGDFTVNDVPLLGAIMSVAVYS